MTAARRPSPPAPAPHPMFTKWLARHWVAIALVLGVLLLVLAPWVAHRLQGNLWFVLVYLQTPLYMLHQVEEHAGDRFRTFVNRRVYGGLDALTPATVLVTNIPGVWGVTALSLYLAVRVGAGWGLLGLYLIAVNVIAHVASCVLFRGYNPGLWTALLLFLPLAGLTFWKSAAVDASWIHHAVGLAAALAIHAALVLHTRRRAARLRLARRAHA